MHPSGHIHTQNNVIGFVRGVRQNIWCLKRNVFRENLIRINTLGPDFTLVVNGKHLPFNPWPDFFLEKGGKLLDIFDNLLRNKCAFILKCFKITLCLFDHGNVDIDTMHSAPILDSDWYRENTFIAPNIKDTLFHEVRRRQNCQPGIVPFLRTWNLRVTEVIAQLLRVKLGILRRTDVQTYRSCFPFHWCYYISRYIILLTFLLYNFNFEFSRKWAQIFAVYYNFKTFIYISHGHVVWFCYDEFTPITCDFKYNLNKDVR